MSEGWFDSDPLRMPLDKLLAWTGQAVSRYHQRTLAAHGLTLTSLGVLGVLGQAGALSHRELAGRLGITPATLTPVADTLEATGDLVRERDVTDRRIVRVSVTPSGRERLARVFPLVATTWDASLPRLPSAHREIVREHLLGVLAAVGADDTVSGPARRGLIVDFGGVLDDGPEVLDAVRRARAAGVATAVVTDAHLLPDGYPDLFDAVVLGPAFGVRKPDPELFRRVAERLGVPVGNCVVVDDTEANIRGARAAGAVVIRHRDPSTTVTEVEILLGLHGDGPRPDHH